MAQGDHRVWQRVLEAYVLLTIQSEQKPPFLPHVGATVTGRNISN